MDPGPHRLVRRRRARVGGLVRRLRRAGSAVDRALHRVHHTLPWRRAAARVDTGGDPGLRVVDPFPQCVLPRADRAHRDPRAYGEACWWAVDLHACEEASHVARALGACRGRRPVARERRRLRRTAVHQRPLGAHRANRLGRVPERAVSAAAVHLARLADREQLGQLQRSAAAELRRHRVRGSAPRGDHGLPPQRGLSDVARVAADPPC